LLSRGLTIPPIIFIDVVEEEEEEEEEEANLFECPIYNERG
jgi:predicted nucleotide-binding protein (sugar kinase/HSP70/actin superfamily)